MMLITDQNHIDASAGAEPRPRGVSVSCVTSDRNHTEVISTAPVPGGYRGQDRLQGNTEIFGIDTHAAVRMHALPVTGSIWAYCPKTKTPHFQRLKVAP